MRTIAIINQKGGCGKTTTAINLGASLGRLGRRTLLVDLDPQGHCAAGLGVPESRIDADSSDLLQAAGARGIDPARLLWRCSRNLDLVPSRVRLAGLEAPGSSFGRREGRERSLAQALTPLASRFDVCLLDCPPSIGLLTFNALVAADLVLVPVETGYFSLQGAARQLTTVRAVGRRLSTDIRCAVLPTLHEPGLSVAEDLLDELKRRFGRRLLPVAIRRDTAIRESTSFGRPVCDHAPRSTGAQDYAALASVLSETESLFAGASDDDWAPIEAAAETEPPRPTAPQAGQTPPASPTKSEQAGSGMILPQGSGSTISAPAHLSAPALGEVIVTLSNGEIRSGLSPRVADAKPSPTRAEEIAMRAAQPRPTAGPPAARPVFGCRVTGEGVEFVQPTALGRRVAVAGTFTQWQPIDLAPDDSLATHSLRLNLQPGRHEYRLIVDGHWIADPYNTEWVLSESGEPHSIVEIPGSADQAR